MDICLKYKQFLNYVANSLSNKTVFAQSNHINELRSLRADTQREMQQLYTYSTYNKNPYFEE
jgi:hypothetical protein